MDNQEEEEYCEGCGMIEVPKGEFCDDCKADSDTWYRNNMI